MDKEGPSFLRVQFPASGMRQWKLGVVGHWEEDSTSENIFLGPGIGAFVEQGYHCPRRAPW